MQNPKELKPKVSGVLAFIHLIAGSSILVKGAIVGAALIAGYGSIAIYKSHNQVEEIAEQVITEETGIDFKFEQQ